jgi:hypothetical protein
MNVRYATSSTILTDNDDVLLVSGSITSPLIQVTLPLVNALSGKRFYIRTVATGNGGINVIRSGSNVIDLSITSRNMNTSPPKAMHVISDGINTWWHLSEYDGTF